MKLSLIAAYDEKKGVGINNTLPWHFSEDLKRFKTLTNHKPIIMGRKTFESLGRLLPNRKHIILSRDKEWAKTTMNTYPEITIYSDINEMLSVLTKSYTEDQEIFIIGGTAIWQSMFPFLDMLYITHVNGSYEVDTYFPDWDINDWKIVNMVKYEDFNFTDYIRK